MFFSFLRVIMCQQRLNQPESKREIGRRGIYGSTLKPTDNESRGMLVLSDDILGIKDELNEGTNGVLK